MNILTSYKYDNYGARILDENDKPIQDMVNTLVFSISQYFVGDPSHFRDKTLALLSNMKCKSLGEFHQYKNTFFQRVLLGNDCNQPFWKEKF